ncbi:MAG: hypothetical protein JO257_12435 [Deltaproteobacteria bacterium]|nr:hypothetical protein [Deltaproteobacteria bacterium]
MSQGGRTCRKVGRGGGDAELEIEDTGDAVIVRRGGRTHRLTGADAEAVRAVIDDDAALARVIARKLR